MSRAILVKVRRRVHRPVGARIAAPASADALAVPVAMRHEIKVLALVLVGWSADALNVEAIAYRCGAGADARQGRYSQHAGACGWSAGMRGPTAAESRSLAARFEQAGAL